MVANRTTMAKTGQVEQKWIHVDATDIIVGRLASDIATILMGKHRPIYTPHVDCGDFVVVTNVEKVAFTGNKWRDKTYTWYTGYPGQRSITAGKASRKEAGDDLTGSGQTDAPKELIGA